MRHHELCAEAVVHQPDVNPLRRLLLQERPEGCVPPVDQEFIRNCAALQILHQTDRGPGIIRDLREDRNRLQMNLLQSLFLSVLCQLKQKPDHLLIALLPFFRIPRVRIIQAAGRRSHHVASKFRRQVGRALQEGQRRIALRLFRRKKKGKRIACIAAESRSDPDSFFGKCPAELLRQRPAVFLRPPRIDEIPGKLDLVDPEIISDHGCKYIILQPALHCK